MKTGYRLNMYKNIIWNTGPAAMRARHNIKMRAKKLKHTNLKEKYASLEPSNEGWHNLKLKKKKRPPARKLQASSGKRHEKDIIKWYKEIRKNEKN